MRYPVKTTKLPSGGTMAEFRDVPEALTHGADDANTFMWAQDALLVALSSYMEDHRDIPTPSAAKRGERLLNVPPAQALKLAIYQAMRDQKVTQAELGERLSVDGRQVRRILDLDHASRLDDLVHALRALGKQVSVDIRDAA